MLRIVITALLLSLTGLYVFPDIDEERKWLDCGDRSIPAERTRFHHYGVEIYRSLSDNMLFIIDKDEGVIENCIPLEEDWEGGGSWMLSGFKKIRAGKLEHEKILVFEVKNRCVSRYFNVDNGQEVFVGKAEDGELYVDYEQEVEEPFEYP